MNILNRHRWRFVAGSSYIILCAWWMGN